MHLKDLHCALKKQKGCLKPAHPPAGENWIHNRGGPAPFRNQTLRLTCVIQPACKPTVPQVGGSLLLFPLSSLQLGHILSPDYGVKTKTPEHTLWRSASWDPWAPKGRMDVSRNTSYPGAKLPKISDLTLAKQPGVAKRRPALTSTLWKHSLPINSLQYVLDEKAWSDD